MTKQAEEGFNAAKKHWIFFAILALVLVAWALSYEIKHAGTPDSLSARMAKWPIIGSLFFKPSTTA